MDVRVLLVLSSTQSWTSFNPQTRHCTKQPRQSQHQPASTRASESTSAHRVPPVRLRRRARTLVRPAQPHATPSQLSLVTQIGKHRRLEAYDEAGDLSRAQTNDSCPCQRNRRNQSQHTNAMRIDKMRFRCRVNINAQPSTRDDSDKPRCLELAFVLPACGA